jgi:hypothetical protein
LAAFDRFALSGGATRRFIRAPGVGLDLVLTLYVQSARSSKESIHISCQQLPAGNSASCYSSGG